MKINGKPYRTIWVAADGWSVEVIDQTKLPHRLEIVALKALPVLILGGFTSIPGAIVGGLIIGLLETLTGGYISPSLRDVVPYVVLVVILMLKPYGLFGQVEIERV